jgi:hypothetical protein
VQPSDAVIACLKTAFGDGHIKVEYQQMQVPVMGIARFFR